MHTLAALGPFLRLILRRDRLRLTLWYGIAVVVAVGVAASIGATYPTQAARAGYAEEINSSPAEVFMIGRINAASVAGLVAWRVQGLVVLVLGIASAFTVIRHTRTAEEDGYREFLAGTPLGRATPLAGSVIIALSANLATAVLIAAAFAALGFPAAGSVLTGAQFFAAGAFMTGVGAITAMLAATSRGASTLAVIVMSVFYAVRGTADAGGLPALSWWSPYGWLSRIEPYAADDVRPVLLALVFSAVLLAVATLLNARDVGAGLLPERNGRPRAARGLRGTISLTLRLSLGQLIAWSLALFAFGSLIGALAENTAEQLRESDALSGLADGPDPALAFIALVVYVFAQVVTLYGIQAILRLHREESSGRAENVLTAPVSRMRWAGGALVAAFAGTAVIQVSFGFGLGLMYATATGEPGQLAAMIAAVLVKLPAIWLIAALAALLYGFVPRIAGPVAYAVLGILFVLELLVELGYLDSGVLRVSPYTHMPPLPLGTFELLPILVTTVLAAVLVIGASAGLRRRDITRT